MKNSELCIEKLKCAFPFIKSNIAFKALAHVILRAKQINSGFYPIIIDHIGVGGSVLRSKDVGDIDIVVVSSNRPEYASEWEQFKKLLRENFIPLWELLSLTRDKSGKGKATIKDMISLYRERLTELGFKEKWIKCWFSYLRVTDFRYGIDRGLPLVFFDEKELITRYLKKGYAGKRMEIHVKIRGRIPFEDIPYIVLWRKNRGLTNVSTKELLEYFKKEYERLINIVTDLRERKMENLPPIYYSVIYALQNKLDEEPQLGYLEYTSDIHKMIIISMYEETVKLLREKFELLKEYINIKPTGVEEFIDSNSKLRRQLQELLALAYIIERFTTSKFRNIVIMSRYGDAHKFLNEITKYIIRTGVVRGYRKDALLSLINRLKNIAMSNIREIHNAE